MRAPIRNSLRVQDLGFLVLGSGFRGVYDLGFKICFFPFFCWGGGGLSALGY